MATFASIHPMNPQQMTWRQEEQRALATAQRAFEAWRDAHHQVLEAGSTEDIESAYRKAKVAGERLGIAQEDCARMIEEIRSGARY